VGEVDNPFGEVRLVGEHVSIAAGFGTSSPTTPKTG